MGIMVIFLIMGNAGFCPSTVVPLKVTRFLLITTPDPREDPKSRSLKGVPIKYPLIARVPN